MSRTIPRTSFVAVARARGLTGSEVLAGITIWALLVPSALAYSAIAGVDPVLGLVGVPFALGGYALLGGSKVLVVGADAAVSVLVGAALVNLPADSTDGALVTLTALVGITFIALRVLRLGWTADLIPEPVLKGFVQGLAVVTIVGQVAKLLGLTLSGSDGGFFDDLLDVINHLGTAKGATAAIGVVSLAALLLLRHARPAWPSALIVLVVSGIAIAALDLVSSGVTVVGEPTGSVFANALTMPDDFDLVAELWPAALAIVVLGFTESLGASQLVTDYDGERTDPNRELLGLGAANLAVAVGGSFAVTGTLSKTAVAIASGARTRWATVTTAGLAIATIVFLRPLFDYLGDAVLAAVVIWAMAGLLAPDYFRSLWAASRTEFAVSAVAFGGVLVLGVMPAVIVATVLSIGLLGHHVSRPPATLIGQLPDGRWDELSREPNATTPDGLAVCRLDGPLVFVNARHSAQQLRELAEQPGVRVVLLDASALSALDTTGARALKSVVHQMREREQQLWAARVSGRVWDTLCRIAPDNQVQGFVSRAAAVDHFSQLGKPPGDID